MANNTVNNNYNNANTTTNKNNNHSNNKQYGPCPETPDCPWRSGAPWGARILIIVI